VADTNLVGPVVGLPGTAQTDTAGIRPHCQFEMASVCLKWRGSPRFDGRERQLAFSSPIKAVGRAVMVSNGRPSGQFQYGGTSPN
jgi:hypothetical protein